MVSDCKCLHVHDIYLKMFGKIGFCLILFSCIHLSCCQWQFSAEQTEVYDLVDEIKRNFYDLLNVSQVSEQCVKLKIGLQIPN